MAFGWIRRSWQRLMGSEPPVVAVLRLSGAIGMQTGLRKGLSMAATAEPIAKLFADRR